MQNNTIISTPILKKKSAAINNLFRLAESLGYPFKDVVLPTIHDINCEIANIIGAISFNHLPSNFFSHNEIYGKTTKKAEFKYFAFQCDKSKQFSIQMFSYIFVEREVTNFIDLLANLCIEKFLNKDITQALIKYDQYNNIDLSIYSHPSFLIEYYKVSLAQDYELRTVVNDEINLLYSSILPELDIEQFNPKGLFDLKSHYINHSYDFTCGFYDDDESISYSVSPHVVRYVNAYLARLNLEKLSKKLSPELFDVVYKNTHQALLHDNRFFHSCVNYIQSVNPLADQHPLSQNYIETPQDFLFDRYFVAFYTSEYLKALKMLLPSKDVKFLKLSYSDLTFHYLGYIKFTSRNSNLYNIFNTNCIKESGNQFSHYNGMVLIHKKIIENLKANYQDEKSCLPKQLENYIETIFDILVENFPVDFQSIAV